MKSILIGIAALTLASPALAQGDPVAGQRLFIQCRACHSVDGGSRSGIGPDLAGAYGARAGARTGYAYSQAMKDSGLVWTPEALDRFLMRPSAMVRGTKMAFGGVAAPKSRADIIAYLATLKGSRR